MLKKFLIGLLISVVVITMDVFACKSLREMFVNRWMTSTESMQISVYKDTIYVTINAIDKRDDILSGKYNSTEAVLFSVDDLIVSVRQLGIPIGTHTEEASTYAVGVSKDNKEFLLKFITDEGLYGLSENDKILIYDNVIMDTDGIGTIVIGSYELIKEI